MGFASAEVGPWLLSPLLMSNTVGYASSLWTAHTLALLVRTPG